MGFGVIFGIYELLNEVGIKPKYIDGEERSAMESLPETLQMNEVLRCYH